jgi:hypothetical protein
LERADLNDRVSAIRIVGVAGEKSVLNTVSKYVAYVGYSMGVFEVDQNSMTPRCTNLVAVQVGNGLGFAVLRAEI